MFGQILIGLAASMFNIAVHATIMAPMSRSAHRMLRHAGNAHPNVRLALVMMATVGVLMLAHLIEIGVWALVFIVLEVAPKQTDAFYFALVNYTTLGYGDILPVERWRLLGPMTAMNGVLLFGWSTAVIFDVLRRVSPVTPQPPSQRGGKRLRR